MSDFVHNPVKEIHDRTMKLKLIVWRQANAKAKGGMVEYNVEDISPDMSFLEMLDVVNEGLIRKGEDPITFEHDCREGICGSCGFMVNGVAHGPDAGTTVCQLHMRRFNDGDTIYIEPWRARAFGVIKDLMVDRSSMDRIIAAGGYVSVKTGSAPEANSVPVPKQFADAAFDAAACIGCGACIAQCKNASAALFTAAKVSQLAHLPQGKPEGARRVLRMVEQMNVEGFGNCSNEGECEAVCPKEIAMTNIARMNREYEKALFTK
ncbi:MAG: succinate dehydrogenase / fumarate reductase, iron-sulfur subunit [Abditibacteriota bacterium]|nr:succinate dehydrogenase / fumarate reductase, iron-sulfur subunit [Abditibacteriota bacterium]